MNSIPEEIEDRIEDELRRWTSFIERNRNPHSLGIANGMVGMANAIDGTGRPFFEAPDEWLDTMQNQEGIAAAALEVVAEAESVSDPAAYLNKVRKLAEVIKISLEQARLRVATGKVANVISLEDGTDEVFYDTGSLFTLIRDRVPENMQRVVVDGNQLEVQTSDGEYHPLGTIKLPELLRLPRKKA